MGNDLEKQELLDGDRWIIPGREETYQKTQRTPCARWVAAHLSKHGLWMLFPHAALHQTISSLAGSNSIKQMGQSSSMGFRLPAVLSSGLVGWRLRGEPW